MCTSQRRKVGEGREHPLGFEAIPTTHEGPFIDVQPFISPFSKGTIALTPLSFFLEHTFAADLPRANHVLYTIPCFRFISFSLVFPLCRGFLLFSFTSEDSVILWRQGWTLYALASPVTGLRRSTIDAVGGHANFCSSGPQGCVLRLGSF
jgi:hypothetical protein